MIRTVIDTGGSGDLFIVKDPTNYCKCLPSCVKHYMYAKGQEHGNDECTLNILRICHVIAKQKQANIQFLKYMAVLECLTLPRDN